jgi:actinin alpha
MAQFANPQQFGAPQGTMGEDGQYMQQDEEWEREGLLDPAWEKQQRKVTKHIIIILPQCCGSYFNG